MTDYIHDGIDLENTKIIWECDECGNEFEDDGSWESDICPKCGKQTAFHSHEPLNYMCNKSIEV